MVNSQVTDAVTQTDTLAVGEGAPLSMAMVYTVMSETIGMVMHNAVTTQRGMQAISNSAAAVVCSMIISKGAASG